MFLHLVSTCVSTLFMSLSSFSLLSMCVCWWDFICVLFNKPWMAVPGQDEQLFTDWSVTWWWVGGWVGGVGCGMCKMFFHMKDHLLAFHPLLLELTLSRPPRSSSSHTDSSCDEAKAGPMFTLVLHLFGSLTAFHPVLYCQRLCPFTIWQLQRQSKNMVDVFLFLFF